MVSVMGDAPIVTTSMRDDRSVQFALLKMGALAVPLWRQFRMGLLLPGSSTSALNAGRGKGASSTANSIYFDFALQVR